MKKILFTLLLLSTLAITPASPSASPTVKKAHKATHKLNLSDLTSGSSGHCSGTAIGPHALLTATHCIKVSPTIDIDGKDAEIMSTLGDGLDHTILLLRGVNFTEYSDVKEAALEQSEEVFVFGNPGAFTDMYRRGVVAGSKERSDVHVTYYDFNGFFGDSGSGIFDEGGAVTAVTSFIDGEEQFGYSVKFMGSYEMRFTKAQLESARRYDPPKGQKKATPTPTPKVFFNPFNPFR